MEISGIPKGELVCHLRSRLACCFSLAIALLTLGGVEVKGATLTVTTLADSGAGSLRSTLAAAKAGDTINSAVQGTIALTNGPLVVSNNVQIVGPGVAALIIDTKRTSSAFIISTNVTATISDLTIANGQASGTSSTFGRPVGGGIQNFGTLVLARCAVRGCDATDGSGGGIFNVRTLTLQQCSIASNTAALGGGICDLGNGLLVVDSCTINANRTSGPTGDNGGGILKNAGSLMMTNSTVSLNSSHDGTGGIDIGGTATLVSCTIVSNTSSLLTGGMAASAPVNFRSTIIALNFSQVQSPGSDFDGTLNSAGYNLIQDTNGCTITGTTTGNVYGANPSLGPLQNNGGPTLTHALLAGSPAIDHGTSGGLSYDQRGYSRIFDVTGPANVGDGADIGSMEYGSSVPVVPPTPPVSGWTPLVLGTKLVAWYEAGNSFSDTAMTIKAPNNSLVRGLKNMVNSGTILDRMTNNDLYKVSQPYLNTNTSSGLPSLYFRANPANGQGSPYPLLNENGYLSAGNGTVFQHPHTFYVLATGQWETNLMWGQIWGEADQGIANEYEESMYTSYGNVYPEGASGYVQLMQAPFYAPMIDRKKMHLWVAVFTDPQHGYLWIDGTNFMNGLDQNFRPIKGLNIGGRYAVDDGTGHIESTHSLGGDVAALWFINGTLTTNEHAAMTNWIRQKFGNFPR